MNCKIGFFASSFVILIVASARGQATPYRVTDWNIYRVRQFAIAHLRPVSFSVGYPKGWAIIYEGLPPIGEYFTMDKSSICAFWSKSGGPNRPMIDVSRAPEGTAEDEANRFAALLCRGQNDCIQRSASPVRTSAGDTGYLVVLEETSKARHVVESDYFFHVRSNGAIHISITTEAKAVEVREQLQNLVLKTLRFPDD